MCNEVLKTMQQKTSPKKDFEEKVRKVKTGSKNVLTIWLDQHSDHTSFGTVYDDYNGFKVQNSKDIQKNSKNLSDFYWSTC